MTSITKLTTPSADDLKASFDSALARVSNDVDDLKEELTTKNVINQVIIKDRFARLRAGITYIRNRPAIPIAFGLLAATIVLVKLSVREETERHFA